MFGFLRIDGKSGKKPELEGHLVYARKIRHIVFLNTDFSLQKTLTDNSNVQIDIFILINIKRNFFSGPD